jgi:Cdc6-like AAA superfamily ATPase
MTPSEIILNLKSKYSKAKLSEADTRFKIIDTILLDILKWQKDPLMLEVIYKSVRADYVLYGKNSRPLLIIESKKNGSYFSLPSNINSTLNYQKITVEKLLTDRSLKSAIEQVKEYCEDLGCNFACVCNGHVWVFFCINSTLASWKKLPAFVIRDISFFSDNYNIASQIFSYNEIVNNSSLRNNIGVFRQSNPEIFFPKSSITAYDMPVNSNHFANYFNSISRKYFGNIPLDDDDFYQNCYVTNRGHYDNLQKNIHGIIYDSLTPFFKNQGFQNFDEKKIDRLVLKMEELLRSENLDNVMILFGGRGSGKSTFLRRLLKHLKPKVVENSITALVDLIDSSQIQDELSREIWQKALIEIDQDKLLDDGKLGLLTLFEDRFLLYKKQILDGYEQDSSKYNDLVNEFLLETKKDIKYCCERVSKYWKKKNRGLIIILDNMDQLRPELQDISFLNANEIAKKLGCLVIISMREERFFNAKSKGVLDAYLIQGFHITSPVITEVIGKRIDYAIKKLEEKVSRRREIGIDDESTFLKLKDFFKVCDKEIKRNGSDLSKFLRYSTHGDVRQALDFFKGFIESGYTNVNEISSDINWKLQSHQVIKPMMIPSRFFYSETKSRMPNLYQLRNDANSSHFCGLRILNVLNAQSHDKTSAGMYDVKFLLQKFENEYNLKTDCTNHLEIFLAKGIIEANNRLEEFNEHVDQVKITSFGKYMLDSLAFDFTYLDLISLDCGVFDEGLSSLMIKSAEKEVEYYHAKRFFDRVHLRLNRVDKFIEYLEKQEVKEFEELGFGDEQMKFAKKIRDQFEIKKPQILRSVQNKQYFDSLNNPELPF